MRSQRPTPHSTPPPFRSTADGCAQYWCCVMPHSDTHTAQRHQPLLPHTVTQAAIQSHPGGSRSAVHRGVPTHESVPTTTRLQSTANQPKGHTFTKRVGRRGGGVLFAAVVLPRNASPLPAPPSPHHTSLPSRCRRTPPCTHTPAQCSTCTQHSQQAPPHQHAPPAERHTNTPPRGGGRPSCRLPERPASQRSRHICAALDSVTPTAPLPTLLHAPGRP
jgi:hypothetical protein